jgi:hypothetical protein
MNEKLLHFIWKFRLFNQHDLKTTTGETVELIHPGIHNTDSGADFQNAKIKIGKTLWAGNVELHVDGSDWFVHKHQNDEAYNNIILHVVNNAGDKPALRKNGEAIPTLELKNRINDSTLARYGQLAERQAWIPCAKFYNTVDEFTRSNFLERLLVERLEGKVNQILLLLEESGNDWENVMFQMVARYLGASVNKDPFLMVAKSLPVKIWGKHQNDLLQMEALLFGQAGFLEEKYDDEYPNQLRKEYLYLKRLHNLQPLQKHTWKFLRLRPSNFPTVRLAQLAALMHKEVKLFSGIINAKDAKAIHQFFDVGVSSYWQAHYQFDKPAEKVNAHLGAAMKDILLINAVVPVLFAYGKYKGDEAYCDKAINLLENCKPEVNSVITGWKQLDETAASAYKTQSLIQLKKEYCDSFRCLECAIGGKILK